MLMFSPLTTCLNRFRVQHRLSYFFFLILTNPGSSIETHHDISYKAKFMSAIRLWKKQDEEKKARWSFYLFILPRILKTYSETYSYVWLFSGATHQGGPTRGGLGAKRQVYPFQPNDCQVSRRPHLSPGEKTEGRGKLAVRQGLSGSD